MRQFVIFPVEFLAFLGAVKRLPTDATDWELHPAFPCNLATHIASLRRQLVTLVQVGHIASLVIRDGRSSVRVVGGI